MAFVLSFQEPAVQLLFSDLPLTARQSIGVFAAASSRLLELFYGQVRQAFWVCSCELPVSSLASAATLKQCPASRAFCRWTVRLLNRGAFRARLPLRELCAAPRYRTPRSLLWSIYSVAALVFVALASPLVMEWMSCGYSCWPAFFPSRALSPPRAVRETRHMSSAPKMGLLYFWLS